MQPLASNISPKKMTGSGFEKRDILVPRTIKNLKLTPLTAALTRRCVADEIISRPVQIVMVMDFLPSTIDGIIPSK
jgi:hypothetical protein